MQLVLQRCCQTSWIAMLGVLPPSSNLPCNESPKLLTGMNEGGKRSLFQSAFCRNTGKQVACFRRLRRVSLFLQIYWEQCTRAGAAKPQDARHEGGSAISHARGHLRVSRFARRTTKQRETARSLMFLLPVLPKLQYSWHLWRIVKRKKLLSSIKTANCACKSKYSFMDMFSTAI